MKYSKIFLILVLSLFFAQCVLAEAPVFTINNPLNNTEHGGNITITITSSISANISIKITSQSEIIGQFNSNEAEEHLIVFDTINGSFSDGLYEIVVDGFDAENESNEGESVSINIEIDNTAPEISGVSIADITPSSATISWTTNENADSEINYGTDASLGTLISDPKLSTAHEIIIIDIESATAYYFTVKSCDVLGNCNTAGIYLFITSQSSPLEVEEEQEVAEEEDVKPQTQEQAKRRGALVVTRAGIFQDYMIGYKKKLIFKPSSSIRLDYRIIELLKIENNKIDIRIGNEEYQFGLNDEITLDTDKDGVNDINLKLVSIHPPHRVKFFIKSLYTVVTSEGVIVDEDVIFEEIEDVIGETEGIGEKTSEEVVIIEEKAGKISTVLIFLIIGVIVTIFLIIKKFSSKKEKEINSEGNKKNKSWFAKHLVLIIILGIIAIAIISGILTFQYSSMWGSHESYLSQLTQSKDQIPCPELSNAMLYGYDAQAEAWIAEKMDYSTETEKLIFDERVEWRTSTPEDSGFPDLEPNKVYYMCDSGSRHIELGNVGDYEPDYVYCGDFIRPIVLYELDANGNILNDVRTSVEIIFDSKTKNYIDTKCGTYDLLNAVQTEESSSVSPSISIEPAPLPQE